MRMTVWKNANGMWEMAPTAGWFSRFFGFRGVKSTKKWIWQTEFDTHSEALKRAVAIAVRDPLCFPTHLMTPRDDPRSRRIARELGWYR